MLRIFPSEADPVWFDLKNPTAQEIERVALIVGQEIPTRESLDEIETSSRLRASPTALTLSMPTALHDGSHGAQASPLGFVLTPRYLASVRFADMESFDSAAKACTANPVSSLEVFATLSEEMVDHLADVLEHLAGVLRAMSGKAFGSETVMEPAAEAKQGGLRDQLRRVGKMGDHASDLRNALLALERIVNFVGQRTEGWKIERPVSRFASLTADIASLREYEVQLAERIQFLLDALVGMIGIAQNEIFKVLTIVSIVGIPPTLVASIYGMNFKFMPELQWAWGYPYGLAVIALSALVPVVWFKWKGWF